MPGKINDLSSATVDTPSKEIDPKKRVIDTAKSILKDRVLSSAKDNIIREPIVKGGTALALAYGLKRGLGGQSLKALDKVQRNQAIRKAVLNYALPTYAVTGLASDVIVPSARMNRLHRKEFGENPTALDYAKLGIVKGGPSALYYGLMLKNKNKLADSMVDIVKNVPKVVSKTSFNEKKKALKMIGGGLAAGGAMKVIGDTGDLVQYVQTPETIVNAKKKKLESNQTIKNAFNIVEDAFEKIASGENLLL